MHSFCGVICGETCVDPECLIVAGGVDELIMGKLNIDDNNGVDCPRQDGIMTGDGTLG